jgi:peptide/nickel transport system ATP-binding protein|tara:strand:+ start:1303 stop:3198 length:1896 start_codon:yes stop_codon:yes gene_type:complete
MPLLEIKNLVTAFETAAGRVPAVDGVSLAIERGRTLGLVGESGSGKSVTAMSILRLVSPPGKIEAGEILISQEHEKEGALQNDLVKLPEKDLRKIRGNRIGMIFQEPMTSLNPVYTTGNQVMEAILLHQDVSEKDAKQKTIDLFREVGIPDPEDRIHMYPHEMSGGQKQRVMIAMALSCNPNLLIADEPTTALDVTIQAQILDLLRKLRDERGMGMIFITHDLGVIAEIADEVAVMYRGKLVEYGDVVTTFKSPQHPYTKGLLSCRPKLDSSAKRLPTVPDFMDTIYRDDGSFAVKEKEVTDEWFETMAANGRDRYLYPLPRLKSLGFSDVLSGYSEGTTFVKEEEQPLLSVRDLKVHFPVRRGLLGKIVSHVKAVDGVSFDIYKGQTLGLVGESGCGKTTTGRAIMRLIDPTAGQVIFDGTDITTMRQSPLRSLRQRFQIIFQDPYGSLNPRKTIETTVMEPMDVHGIGSSYEERREMVLSLLEKVGLPGKQYLSRYPHEFSGGQRQRICIARSLAVKPDLIICDESVSALDVSVQAQVLNLLKDLQLEFGLTYVFISHDLSVVKFMSDMMAVMHAGTFVEYGPSESIYANPKKAYTRRLIDSIPRDNLEQINMRQQQRLDAQKGGTIKE